MTNLPIRERLGMLVQHADDKQRWTTKEIAEAALVHIDILEAALRTLADWKAPAGRRTEYGQGFDEAREQVALIAREALESTP